MKLVKFETETTLSLANMTDILDINSCVEFEHDEAGDKEISNLKESARKRKGRGIYHDVSPREIPTSHCILKYRNYKFQSGRRENWDTDASETSSVPSISLLKLDNKSKYQYNQVVDVVPQKSIEGWVLFASPIHEEATEEDIYDKFSEIGPVKSIGINLDRRTGFLKGYALIEYSSFEEALQAKETLDGAEMLGFTLNVNWCFIKGPNQIRTLTK